MDLTIDNNRQIKPYKVSVKQYESGTTTMVFTRDGYMYDQVDLRRYKAYAITSINGSVDMTELETEVVDGNLVITWVIQEYTLRQAGTITYQIAFKENEEDGDNTGVFHTYEAILQNSASIDADREISANYPTILKQWLDLINNLAGTISAGIVYMPVGNPTPVEERLAGRVYYQIENAETYEGHFENNLGNVIGSPTCKYLVNANVNKIISNGDYVCSGNISNAPIACDFCIVKVTDTPTTDRVLQEVYVVAADNTIRTFTRAITGVGTFGAWRENAALNGWTANRVLVTDGSGNMIANPQVSYTELTTLKGVTSNVQTQLNDKQTQINSKLAKSGHAAKMVVVTGADGNITTSSTITTDELFSLDGVTSNIQVQLNDKASDSELQNYTIATNGAIDVINQTMDTIKISTDIIEQSFVGHAENASSHVSPSDREKWNGAQAAFPVGTLIPSVCTTISGWLLCDGSTYNTADYPNLAAALGATGSTFQVPDFRERTLWGASTKFPVGTTVSAGLPNVTGELNLIAWGTSNTTYQTGMVEVKGSGGSGVSVSGTGNGRWAKFDLSYGNPIYGLSNTVRPPSIAVNIFIKY